MPRAERDLAELYEHIDAARSEAAFKWYKNLKQSILDLEENPNRWPAAPESSDLRQLLYGHKPNIYRVVEKQQLVEIIHIRHGARDRLKTL